MSKLLNVTGIEIGTRDRSQMSDRNTGLVYTAYAKRPLATPDTGTDGHLDQLGAL